MACNHIQVHGVEQLSKQQYLFIDKRPKIASWVGKQARSGVAQPLLLHCQRVPADVVHVGVFVRSSRPLKHVVQELDDVLKGVTEYPAHVAQRVDARAAEAFQGEQLKASDATCRCA